jgi:quercetin dioxygenase-like cupin family protein
MELSTMRVLIVCLATITAACASQPSPQQNHKAELVPALVIGGASEVLEIGEGQVRILAAADVTGGSWAALERTEPPDTRTGLHRHNSMDEAFYVVSGTLTVFVNGRLHELPPGSFVFIPRGTPHAQGNRTPSTIKVVSFFSPAGWEQSARARAEVHRKYPAGTAEFAERIGEVFSHFDIEVLGPSPLP